MHLRGNEELLKIHIVSYNCSEMAGVVSLTYLLQ
jgi:hypothetical protein